eukprot:m.38652 g.38652  ORF g.38652 m.38652 type:complete len:749 (+) comp9460_c0_seq1:108-2354(+)
MEIKLVLIVAILGIHTLATTCAPLDVYVNCNTGDDNGSGSTSAPYKTLHRAQASIRTSRVAGIQGRRTVHVSGWCIFSSPLVLDTPLDSNVTWTKDAAWNSNVLLSGGTPISPKITNVSQLVSVDLGQYNFTKETLGNLTGRGYSGGSACILLNNFEESAAELFYRAANIPTAGQAAATQDGVDTMYLARYPNKGILPNLQDWMGVKSVDNHTLTLMGPTAEQIQQWQSEPQDKWAHGLWSWNWADSHRPVVGFNSGAMSITVGDDNINRDVNLAPRGRQGGNLYVYNLKSELDTPGEYYIDKDEAMLYFYPPHQSGGSCTYNVTISRSDKPGVSWQSLIIEGQSSNAAFKFSGCETSGTMGNECVHSYGVPEGAHALVNEDGVVVGEGVCCNGVSDSVISTQLLSCTKPFVHSNGTFHISRLSNIISVEPGVSDVTFADFEIRYSRGAGVRINGGMNITLERCTVSDHGMMGVNITNGFDCGVSSSDIGNNGDVGVALYGGDRQTLTPSNHFVENCTVHYNQRWIMNYAPNVFLGGVGQRISNSSIYSSPQIGVFMQGNDHTMEYSELHDLGQQCSDCAGFYMGRDWTYRGNLLLGNTWYNIASIFQDTPHAVYLDDQLSSVSVIENVFNEVGSVILLGGGRHNIFERNILNSTGHVVLMDARGGGGTRCCHANALPYSFLFRVPYNTSTYAKYAGLANILNDDPCEPKYNSLSNNVLCGRTTDMGISSAQVAAWGSIATNNTVGKC